MKGFKANNLHLELNLEETGSYTHTLTHLFWNCPCAHLLSPPWHKGGIFPVNLGPIAMRVGGAECPDSLVFQLCCSIQLTLVMHQYNESCWLIIAKCSGTKTAKTLKCIWVSMAYPQQPWDTCNPSYLVHYAPTANTWPATMLTATYHANHSKYYL